MSVRKIFGTDGVRGLANKGALSPNNILKLAQAVSSHFIQGEHKHRVVIGKDTRLSGYMIEPALTAGFISMGMDVILVGPLPTPAIAMLTRSLRADLGVMISASHNPFEDNGLKFFNAHGLKLDDCVEKEIENIFSSNLIPKTLPAFLGHAQRLDDAQGRYIEYLKNAFPKNLTLENLHIVLDCANGAAYKVAPTVFWELGATVTTINANPNGLNINNKCGATNTKELEEKVKELKANIGIALDGDADRVIFVDENGKTIHGDHLMGSIASAWKDEGKLASNSVVGTIMCNKGLEEYLSSIGIALHRSNVGDRYVSKYMSDKKSNLGGEPSGHIIMSDYTTTGDGILSALQLLAYLLNNKKQASSIHHLFNLFPQGWLNINCADKLILETPETRKILADFKNLYKEKAHIIIRPSGTEPLIRITVQAKTQDLVDEALISAEKCLKSIIQS